MSAFIATVERDDLLKKLTIAQRMVERRVTIPILSHVLLRLEAGRLHIRATDLDIEASLSLPATVGAPGSVTVPAHTLHDIVRKLPEGSSVAMETKDATLVIRSGRSRFTLQALAAEDFPDLSVSNLTHHFEIAAAVLADLIGRASFAISTEETRYYLNGIYLHTVAADGADMLRAVATDGHRLARIDAPAPEGSGGMPGIIVPRKTVAELRRLLGETGEPVAVSLSDAKIRFSFADGTVLLSKLIDGKFPDYERVVPGGGTSVFRGATSDLSAGIDRVSTISSERGRAVSFAFASEAVTLSVQNPDAGSSEDETEGTLTGEPITIGFNGRYMIDVLAAHGGERSEIEMTSAGAPALIRAEGDDKALFVLMPMRIG